MDETLTATNNDRNRVFTDNPTENLARFGTTGVGGPNVDRTQGLTDAQLRVIRQQQTQPVTAPSPFTVNLADVPDSALGSLTRTDVLNARRGAETQAQTMLAEQNALQNRILEAIRPTETETQLQARLRESSQAEEAGVLGATERALGTTRVARAVQGEQALITQQEQARRRVLADELNALVNQRAVQIDALTQALEFSQENLAGLQTLQQLTKPDVLSTQVDATTGQIIATVQDPNGNVRTQIIGSVTPEVQAKTLNNTGTFTDEQGNLVFFGIDETGQIIKQVVGKEQVQGNDFELRQVGNRLYRANPATGQVEILVNDPVTGTPTQDTDTNRALTTAMNSIKFSSVASRKDAQNILVDLLATGDTEAAKQFLGTQIFNSATAGQQDVLTGKEDTIVALDRIQDRLAQFEALGGDTGIFTGLSEKALRKGGFTKDPELAGIANDIGLAIIDYRRAVSGAAFTESEAKAYDALFPSIGKTSDLNNALINSVRVKLEADRDNFYRRRIGDNNYNQIFGQNTSGDDLSDDEAYQEYLKIVGQQSFEVPQTTSFINQFGN